MRDWDDYRYFQRSRPKAVRGGIKSQSRRGGFGASWWARRWIQVLESFDIGKRLSRGRAYARSGQAVSIAIDKGMVRAKVQGSRPSPYDVIIRVRVIEDAEWKKLSQAISAQALFTAKLLAGEMPPGLEEVFAGAGIHLFPESSRDLHTDCSCPDWSNPCKHIAAVYYLLAEEFDRDPFLIFTLRGRSRDEMLGGLAPAVGEEDEPGDIDPAKIEPLPSDPDAFWKEPELSDELSGSVEIPPVNAVLLRRLGGFPFWQGSVRLLDALDPVYRRSSAAGLEMFLGGRREGS